jgi:hypothetical protein
MAESFGVPPGSRGHRREKYERGRDAAIRARMQMAMTEPTTPSGAGAMISYMAAELVDDDFEDDSWHAIALKTVSAALTRTSKRT